MEFQAQSIENILRRMRGEKVYIKRQPDKPLSPIPISKHNLSFILDFNRRLLAEGIKDSSRLVYFNFFVNLCEFNGKKPFETFTRADIEEFIGWLKKPGGRRKNGLAESSLNNEKIRLKRFFKFVHGDGQDYPEQVKWITFKNGTSKDILASDILTPEDVKKIIIHTPNIRDRALIHVAYESAARRLELYHMLVGDAIFNTDGTAFLSIRESKTKRRTVLLIDSVPILKTYLNDNHPYAKDPKYPLWISHNRIQLCKQLQYASFRTIIQRSVKLAGLKRRVFFHMLRRSRLHECSKFLADQELKQFAGWTRSSKMADVYIRITPEDVMNKQREHAGLKKPEEIKKERTVLSPVKCLCSHRNPISAVACERCYRPLTLGEAMRQEKKQKASDIIMDRVLELDPTLKKKIEKAALQKVEELRKLFPDK